ncbi:Rpn family recombination-promoting nuclease/putative transposase [Pedobacter africanus]|nr:Rpn family recombination-promoting nuclease/putative transposase [Pedobacter africanus]
MQADLNQTTTYIDPFVDFSFKRLLATEESKPILIGLLNHLFKGRKYIIDIEYGKTDFPGEISEEGGAVFDVFCTDADGSKFIIEIQRGYQKHFKERALFYTSRAISEQAPKGNRKEWAYNLTEVYLIAFLEDFCLPDSPRSEYIQDICLAIRHTGKIFYDKLNLIFIEMLNFVKKPVELYTDLEKWLYAFKHLTEFKKQPEYLNGPEFDRLFNLAKYANLTAEERAMYNRSLKQKWDNKNVMDYAVAQGELKGKHERSIEIALKMVEQGFVIEDIIKLTDLTKEEILVLKK